MAEQHFSSIDKPMRVQGKIDRVESFENKETGSTIYQTLVLVPNSDPYGSPIRVPVKSQHKIGKQADQVDVVVDLRGRFWRNNNGKTTNYIEAWLHE